MGIVGGSVRVIIGVWVLVVLVLGYTRDRVSARVRVSASAGLIIRLWLVGRVVAVARARVRARARYPGALVC